MVGGLLQGSLPAELANQVSQALATAMKRGAAVDEACCVAVQVVADHWRLAYGDDALETLCQVVRLRAGMPLPAAASEATRDLFGRAAGGGFHPIPAAGPLS